jgi:hypothetical protein
MKKELLVETVSEAVAQGIEKYYDDIVRDMQRQFDEGDPDKAFKFPVTVKLTLKPSGDKSKVGIDLGWNNPRKVSLGDYVMDESGQQDMFKQNGEKADENHEVPMSTEEVKQIEAGEAEEVEEPENVDICGSCVHGPKPCGDQKEGDGINAPVIECDSFQSNIPPKKEVEYVDSEGNEDKPEKPEKIPGTNIDKPEMKTPDGQRRLDDFLGSGKTDPEK